jgi:hypothetical protein
MAEKVIGLRIQLNGFDGVVTSIKQLEEELKKAKEDLNQLEIGSNNFKELQTQISNTEGKLQGLKKASEGIGLEKQLEGYGKLAGGITSSFAAAQAAVSLFGADSTAVAEAAAKAQSILTLALSARGIQETLLGAEIVARTIAEKAATAATLATNNALKLLYTTIATNPIGALVAALGLLVGAMIAFNSESEQTIDTQKELGKVTSDEAVKLKTYGRILQDTTSTNKQRKEVIQELNKIYPGFNALIGAENKLNEDGKKFLDAKVQSLILEAQTKLIIQKIAENNNKIIETENQSLEDNVSYWESLGNSLLSFGNNVEAANKDAQTASKNREESTGKITTENEKWYNSLKKVFETSGNLDDILDPITKKLLAQAKAEADLANKTNDANKATDAQIKTQKGLENQLTLTEKLFQSTLEQIKDLVDISKIDVETPEIIKTLEDILNARKGLVPDTLVDIFNKLGFSIGEANGALVTFGEDGEQIMNKIGIIAGETVNTIQDVFGEFYNGLRKDLTEFALQQSVDDFALSVGLIINKAQVKLNEGSITKVAFDALIKITDQYKAINKIIKEIPGIEKLFGVEEIEKFLESQRKISIATNEIGYEFDRTTGLLSKVSKLGIVYSNEIEIETEQIEKFTKGIADYYTKQYDESNKAFKEGVKFSNLTKDQRKQLEEAAKEGGVKLQQIIKEISQVSAQGLKEILGNVIKEENEIREFLFQAQELKKEARAIDAVAVKGALLNNLQLLSDVTQKENKIVIDTKKTEAEQLTALENDLALKGIDISKYSEEEKLKILKYYSEEQVKVTDETEKKKQEKIKDTIDKLQISLSTISKGLSDIASLTAQSFQIQLDRLETSYGNTMDGIVGDTAEANQKRVEAEKAYQQEKAAIERKARLASLKFTLAQTIASGAQAVVSALSLPPPFSAIIAGLNAAVTLLQVGIIQTQINDVQSQPLRRGGVLSNGILAGGGLVSGPSHEQGGVYAGGGYTLEGNEAVINRQSTLQYSGLLSQINQQGGGRPIMVQSAMDSRLVEALAKQKSEPIRAYVVEQDITKAQGINRRLEQLASF